MSALDELIDTADEFTLTDTDPARAELAQLRADVARLTQERDAAQAAVNEARESLEVELVQAARYNRDMKRIFSSNDRSSEIHAIENLASYNYFKGAYEALRKAWWLAAHPAPEAEMPQIDRAGGKAKP